MLLLLPSLPLVVVPVLLLVPAVVVFVAILQAKNVAQVFQFIRIWTAVAATTRSLRNGTKRRAEHKTKRNCK